MASNTGTSTLRPWWQDALIYQVYVRSFADSNGDGVGDLNGVRSRLGHLRSLGVQALWLNPCYPSPQLDHGYDVADYFGIHHEYGTLDDFDALLTEASQHDIKILMDLVPSHCSNQHEWFQAAITAAPGSAERARFYFRDGKDGPEGPATLPPNNWRAAFGGSAWTRINNDPDDGQWYLGTFTPHQPDFDHTNPDVQQHFAEILEFWFDRGVAGFRVDAVAPTGKHPDLPDQPPVGPDVGVLDITWINPYTVFRPEGHDVWRQFRSTVDSYEQRHPGRDLMMVAEAYAVRRPELIKEFTQPNQFHQMFSFDLMLSPWEKSSIELALRDPFEILRDTGVAPAWTLNNHDIQRIVTRLGKADAHLPESWTNNNLALSSAAIDIELGARRARAMTAMIFALPGSLYLYQGEELGLPEVLDISDDRREDPIFHLTEGAEIGRDGCRVPLPWNTDASTSFGFSTPAPDGSVGDPWLPQPDDWGGHALSPTDRDINDDRDINGDRDIDGGSECDGLSSTDGGSECDGLSDRDDEHSMVALYRELGEARAEYAVGEPMHAEVLDLGNALVGVRRGELVVVVNASMEPVAVDLDHPELAIAQPVFSSQPAEMHTPGVIPANATVWFTS